ncbi:flavin reductase family protein [Leifsonia sp. 21MFCrub1.1]|uniref:flavin reductase family protein n=1 Tax=Leifsonia sp. 21MFCrub1.1 TaxID=1798223 RepID=UPI001E490D80|nr:flavin reductase family protein [Leifsonia sp. 21MFCrub1.1]
MTSDEFKQAFRNHAAGVAVITADDGSGPAGLTAASVFSVNAEPPLLVFSLSSQPSSAPTLWLAEHVVAICWRRIRSTSRSGARPAASTASPAPRPGRG